MTSLVTRIPRSLDAATCRDWALRILGAKDAWTPNFGGVQFTLGRAWYTHLEEDREDEYFDGAEESDARVERVLPGFQARVLAIASDLVGAPVAKREEWCGPGVHIFPAGSHVAQRGGDAHFDTEGLSEEHVAARAPALTLVIMLQPPSAGGGVIVWDFLYDGDDFPERPGAGVRSEIVDYKVGELVVIDSYRLHQILPFEGEVDRISATVHLVHEDSGWIAWF